MARHFKINDILSDADRPAYEAMLRDPKTTVDDAFEWLSGRGYEISRGAVHNHKRNFEEVLAGARRSAEMASSFAAVVKEAGFDGVTEAALGRFQQLVMEKLMQIDEGEEIDASELLNISIAMRQSIGSMKDLKRMMAEKFDREVSKLGAEKRALTQADLDEVRKAVFG